MEKTCETCKSFDGGYCGHPKRGECGLGRELWEAMGKKSWARGSVLKKALEIINGERQDSYGNPEDSFALIAEYWNVYLIEVQKKILVKNGFDLDGVDLLSPREVAEMMALFKIARMSGQKPHVDNYVDAAGYIGIAAGMLDREVKK